MFKLGPAIAVVGALFLSSPPPVSAQQEDRGAWLILVSGPAAQTGGPVDPSPEERMRRRFPQPVKVGDLIGLPVLDDYDRTIGRVKAVVRTANGKIRLIVPYGGFLGWGKRPVPVPIEVVAIAGRQLAALDMPREEFDTAPTWDDSQGQPIPPTETISIALYKR